MRLYTRGKVQEWQQADSLAEMIEKRLSEYALGRVQEIDDEHISNQQNLSEERVVSGA
jgi:hypothetical protein